MRAGDTLEAFLPEPRSRSIPLAGGRVALKRRCRVWLPKLASLLGFCLLTGSCSNSGKDPVLQASVAETRAAQRDFRAIHHRWTTLRPAERGKLEPALAKFLENHPDDLRARVVRVYLAWVEVQRGNLPRARELVKEARRGPGGSARDFAAVAEAAILIREGQPVRALAVLAPLEGKIVDPEERHLFGEQRVMAALAARHGKDAVLFLRDWLASAAAEDRDSVQESARTLIREVDTRSLERGLSELDEEAKKPENSNPELSAARSFLRKLARARLVQLAIDHNDGELARRILDSGIAGLKSEQAAELARIAAAGSVVPRVTGRALGVVLSVASPDSRRRSAEVVLGVSRALGLPESAGDKQAVQLITSEDDGRPGALGRALAELAGEGAAILLAGVDTKGAMEASRYAERSQIPVLVLDFVPARADGYTFVIGADRAAEATTLEEGVRKATSSSDIVILGAGGIPCDLEPKAAGLPRFPIQDWKKQGVKGLVVLGGANCARDAARELGALSPRPLFGLGLECGEIVDDVAVTDPRMVLGAGEFPYRRGGEAPDSLKRYAGKSGRGPTWYAALGHDGARLAANALGSFALDSVEAADAVAGRHREGQRLLAEARADLWTSERNGFAGGRVLERKLAVIQVDGKK